MVHDVVPDGVVLLHHHRNHQLGADAVDARNQYRLFVFGKIDLEKAAEPTDRSKHLRAPGDRELPLHLIQKFGRQVDVDAGRLVQIALHFLAH